MLEAQADPCADLASPMPSASSLFGAFNIPFAIGNPPKLPFFYPVYNTKPNFRISNAKSRQRTPIGVMPVSYPTQGALNDVFSTRHPLTRQQPSSLPKEQPLSNAPRPRFMAWSAAEDIKSKASALSDEAQKELQKASATARAKTGQIELYSSKYYAACTLGGLMACVGIPS